MRSVDQYKSKGRNLKGYATMTPKYPEVEVRLMDMNGNSFALLGAVAGKMRRTGIDPLEIAAFIADAIDGDHDRVLRTCAAWVTVW